jgi:hypothetical protein
MANQTAAKMQGKIITTNDGGVEKFCGDGAGKERR